MTINMRRKISRLTTAHYKARGLGMMCSIFDKYIPRQIARELAPLMDSGRSFVAEYQFRNQSPYHDQLGLSVKIKELN
jgi:hypothetical protein